MDFDQCLATGVFTNYFGGGDSVFSWQVASWRRPFMPRHSIWGLAWSINRIEARQIINHHQPSSTIIKHKTGLWRAFWWIPGLAPWIDGLNFKFQTEYTHPKDKGLQLTLQWQVRADGSIDRPESDGGWQGRDWSLCRPLFWIWEYCKQPGWNFLYAQPTRSKEVLSVEMCRDLESKIDGLERKQVDRTRAWQFEGTSRRDILVSEPWRFGTLGSSFLPSPIPCPCHLVLPMRRVDECLDYRAGCMQKISKVNPLLRGGWKESHLLHISQYLTMFVGGIWNCRWFFYLLIGVYIVIYVYTYCTIIKCVRVCVSLFLTFAQA